MAVCPKSEECLGLQTEALFSSGYEGNTLKNSEKDAHVKKDFHQRITKSHTHLNRLHVGGRSLALELDVDEVRPQQLEPGDQSANSLVISAPLESAFISVDFCNQCIPL